MIDLANIILLPSNDYWRTIARYFIDRDDTSAGFAARLRAAAAQQGKLVDMHHFNNAPYLPASNLIAAFNWGETTEGFPYWGGIHLIGLNYGERSDKEVVVKRKRLL